LFNLFIKSANLFLKPVLNTIDSCLRKLVAPAPASPLLAAVSDLTRSKADLIAENALLRQQLLVLKRQVKKPKFRLIDRLFLVFFASLVNSWRQVLLIVKPATLLKWHRAGFKLFWKFKSKPNTRKPKISQDTIDLIRKMTSENPLWGAERIQGELLKLEPVMNYG
jgi:hypothetical protein